jgi:hypothetical protein
LVWVCIEFSAVEYLPFLTVYWSISGAFGRMVCEIDSLMRTIGLAFALPGVEGGAREVVISVLFFAVPVSEKDFGLFSFFFFFHLVLLWSLYVYLEAGLVMLMFI